MRILFLSHYFPPEVNAPASRTFEHARRWVAEGHEVIVITCAPNHPRGQVYPGYANRLRCSEVVEGIRVIRLWTYITPNEGFAKRSLAYLSFLLACTIYIPFMPKADIILTTSPQFFNGLAGYLPSRLKRIPWVLEIRDLWPDSILAVGAIKNRLIIKFLQKLEQFAYQKATHIVPVTDAFREIMIDKGVTAEKISVIKNGADLALFKPVSPSELQPPEPLQKLRKRFVAAYVGTHGMAHHLETVLLAADRLRMQSDIVFLMIGEGAEREKLLEKRDAMKLENVLMLPQYEKELMPHIWSCIDVSLVLLKKQSLFKTVIPSKIFESMAMKKPIILGVEGESKDILETSAAGWAIEPENAEQLAEKILFLYNNANQYHSAADRGYQFVSQYFDRNALALKYLEILTQTVKKY